MRRLIYAVAAFLALVFMPATALAQYSGSNGKIYFSNDAKTAIIRANADGSGAETIVSGITNLGSVPVVSKDGSKIVYEADSGLWIVNIDGTNNHQVPNTENGDYNPIWSPDGNTIYFDVSTDIMSIGADGSGRVTLLAGNENYGYFGPSVSPDGTMLAFIGYNRDAQVGDVYTMSSAGGTATNVTENQERQGDYRSSVWVDWSPDGSQFAVVGDAPGEGNRVSVIDKISVAGGAYTNVVYLNYSDEGDTIYTQVNWSPDGTKMIATKNEFNGEGAGGFVGLETFNSDGTDDPDLTALGAAGDAWWSIPQVVTPGLPDVGEVN